MEFGAGTLFTAAELLALAVQDGKLSLAEQQLTALPPEIGQFTNLQALDLDGNYLTTLPPEICQLANLQHLSLTGNQLTTLPPEICQLANLQHLSLTGNQLTTLPPEICQLANLQHLSLTGNQLTTLPPEICQLANLQTLVLTRNQLTVLPSEVGQLTNLRQLSLDHNRLTALPPEIGQLTNLQVLDLGSNRLTNSQQLSLDGTQPRALPPEIGQLTDLRQLALGNNQLTALPPQTGQLTNLQILILTRNQLTALPSEVGQLTKLRQLALGNNQLTELPPEIGQLTRLQRLTLGNNRLSALPREIIQLTRLQRLTLGNNRLSALPREIIQLTRLQQLSLGNNRLSALPPEIGQLTNLRELALGGNQLTAVPPQMSELTRLRALELSNNQLTVLPRQMADLFTNALVVLSGNPFIEPLPELIKRGPRAVANYLHSLEDAIAQYEAKVLLVGEGNVGKTSLLAALRDFPFIEGRATTHGIEIQLLKLRHPDLGVDMTVRVWDFGGQEVYRISHQFFFSRRALYLVVWNAREGQEQNEVEGWLRRIRLRVNRDARALVVATHCEERYPELDYPQLKRAFAELLGGQYKVDNRTERGISELRTGIAAEVARLPQMGQLISRRWMSARDEILARAETNPQITYDQFVDVCRCHQLDEAEIVTLAELMHDLGQIVYYGSDEGLRDFVVLDPEWLTKAISYVLEDESTREAGGVLDHVRLAEIWKGPDDGLAYPVRYHPYFLRLMEKFDISYRLEDNEYRSLVAQLVPHDRPVLPWDTRTLPPEGIRRLALVCQLSEPVPGLMAWLTVRHHRASIGKHWRSGVFLRHPIAAYASEALVELRTPDQLSLDVRAPSPDYFFNVLRDSIEDLMMRRWPGLSYELFIPCPAFIADGSPCLSLIPMEGLIAYREEGEAYYRCMQCRTKHDLSILFTGFSQPVSSFQPELERLHSDVADVQSSINDLMSHAANTADDIRRIQRAVTTEITDCPRLFTLSPQHPSRRQRLRMDQQHFRLVVWCEHPGHWHPWPEASYSINQPREWILRICPYAILVFSVLQRLAPIASAVTGVVLSPDQLRNAQNELQLMTTLVAALPNQESQNWSDVTTVGSSGQVTRAQGEAWRAVRVLIFEQDTARAFGGLRRVQASSGDFLWVCPDHYSEYDPGLPSIPDARTRDRVAGS